MFKKIDLVSQYHYLLLQSCKFPKYLKNLLARRCYISLCLQLILISEINSLFSTLNACENLCHYLVDSLVEHILL
jgi:hypothetical protein